MTEDVELVDESEFLREVGSPLGWFCQNFIILVHIWVRSVGLSVIKNNFDSKFWYTPKPHDIPHSDRFPGYTLKVVLKLCSAKHSCVASSSQVHCEIGGSVLVRRALKSLRITALGHTKQFKGIFRERFWGSTASLPFWDILFSFLGFFKKKMKQFNQNTLNG